MLSFENVAKELAADTALHVGCEVDLHNQLRAADLGIKGEMHTKGEIRSCSAEPTHDSLAPLTVFRWVHWQLESLKRCRSGAETKEALNNLPNELETAYERILGAIDVRRRGSSLDVR